MHPVTGRALALVILAAMLVLGGRLSPLGTVGVALVVAGVAGLHLAVGSRGGGRPRPRGAGTAWALLTGLLIATYSIVDKAGVTRLHPLPYIALMGLGMSVLLTPAVVRDRLALAREWRGERRPDAPAPSVEPPNQPPLPLLLPLPQGRHRPAGGAVMPPARPRPLPASFETWVRLSDDDEVLALLRLVVQAVERRGFVPAVNWSKKVA